MTGKVLLEWHAVLAPCAALREAQPASDELDRQGPTRAGPLPDNVTLWQRHTRGSGAVPHA